MNLTRLDSGDVANYFAWHTADMVPGLSLPSTLQWHTSVTFSDPWSAWLLLIVKMTCVLVAVIPVAKLLNTSIEHLRGGSRPVPGELAIMTIVERLAGGIMMAAARLDAAAREEAYPFPAAFRTYEDLFNELDLAVPKIRSLFGEGPVWDSAKEFVDSARNYVESARRASYLRRAFPSRAPLDRALHKFREASSAALLTFSAHRS